MVWLAVSGTSNNERYDAMIGGGRLAVK